jgi:outer membrane protein assembly factor BamB
MTPRSFLAVGLTLTLSLSAGALEWPGWRGATRDGRADGFKAPAAWPGKLEKLWTIEIGEGHAAPLVAGDRVYVFARQGEEEVASALALADGRTLWRTSYAAPYQMNPAAIPHGKGPKSTPFLANGRLFTLGISGILSAFDAEKGTLLWRQSYEGRFKATSPLYGTAMSPLTDGGRLFVHVGGHDQGALLGLDAATGKELWSQSFDGPGYASPVLAEIGGTRQLITQTQQHLAGFDPASGAILWRLPFSTAYDQNSVTPLVAGDLVIYSGLGNGLRAVRIARDGKAWTPSPVWQNNEVELYMSSPVRFENLLCGLSHKRKGQVFCAELATGKTLWQTEGREGENATLLAADELLVYLTDGADLVVARPSAERLNLLARHEVASSPTWAQPALVEDRLLVKDKTSLILWRLR